MVKQVCLILLYLLNGDILEVVVYDSVDDDYLLLYLEGEF